MFSESKAYNSSILNVLERYLWLKNIPYYLSQLWSAVGFYAWNFFIKLVYNFFIKLTLTDDLCPWVNVSNKQDADKTNNDISNEIQMSGQILIPEEIKKKKKNKRPKPLTGVDLIKKRITFADFRKKSHELNNIKTNN